MRTKFEFARPDDLTATITMTATIKEWRELVKQLPRDWPSWNVASQVQQVIAAAEEKFYVTSPND